MIEDQYERIAQITKISMLIKLLKEEGKYDEASELENILEAIKAGPVRDNGASLCQGSNEYETIQNITREVLARIRNDGEFAQFVYEELESAYIADFSYDLFSNTKSFAINSGIPVENFIGALNGESSIDRAEGPQQFLTSAMEYFWGDNLKKKVSVRVGIVREIIAIGFRKGVF